MRCERCQSDQECRLVSEIKTDGSPMYYAQCQACGQNAKTNKSIGGQYYSKDALIERGINLETIPVIGDNREKYGHQCEYPNCESRDTQLHHFAPIAYFGAEANNYKTGYYCWKHHQHYHYKMQTRGCPKIDPYDMP